MEGQAQNWYLQTRRQCDLSGTAAVYVTSTTNISLMKSTNTTVLKDVTVRCERLAESCGFEVPIQRLLLYFLPATTQVSCNGIRSCINAIHAVRLLKKESPAPFSLHLLRHLVCLPGYGTQETKGVADTTSKCLTSGKTWPMPTNKNLLLLLRLILLAASTLQS